MLHVRNPIENLDDGTKALFKLFDRRRDDSATKTTHDLLAWATLDVALHNLATGNKGLEMFKPPVDPGFLRPVEPAGAFLSLDVHV